MAKQELIAWIDRLSKEKLPAFAHTARSLASVSRDDESSAQDLSNVILHDSAMTARVLRLANSVLYNPTGSAIETVSYATVMLGFEQVRNLALTVSMIDTVLGSGSQQQVQKEMVCAYHAAVQAQRLAKTSSSEDLEAVYIGALLHRLGPIMFWCFPFDQDEELRLAYQDIHDARKAELATLGFSLDELTSALVSEWHLSDMLGKSLKNQSSEDSERSVYIGLSIADNLEKGWESNEMKTNFERVSKHMGVNIPDAKEHVFASAKIAADGLQSFGFPQSLSIMPPEKKSEKVSKSKMKPVASEEDTALELRILRQFTQMLSDKMDLNRMLMAVIEGIYRVYKMDQVVFALIDHRNRKLQVKYMLGERRDEILGSSDQSKCSGEFLALLIKRNEAELFTKDDLGNFSSEAMDPLIRKLGAESFLVSPVSMQNKMIGIVYADRSTSCEPFDQKLFQGFCHFAIHATLAFNLLQSR